MPDTRPGSPPRPTAEGGAEILEAVRYLNHCLQESCPFGIIISPSPAYLTACVDEFLRVLPRNCQAVRLLAPTDNAHCFLESILIQLGFDPFDSSVDDLQRLLTVVVRQGNQSAGRCIVVLDQAQEFGPRIFEAIRDLVRDLGRSGPAPLFVLTGSTALGPVLDSRGMASVANLTRHRHGERRELPREYAQHPAAAADSDSTTMVPESPEQPHAATPTLVVTLDDAELDRFAVRRDRVLIGRSAHNDLTLPSRFVSRHHAMLLASADGLLLMDLKSTNGTYVNSRAIRARVLRDGDWISMGNYRLRLEDPVPRTAAAVQDPEGSRETVIMRSLHGIGQSQADEEVPSRSGATPAA